MIERDREDALERALAQIENNFGKGSVTRLGDGIRPPIGVIPTGSIALDAALGVGGLPRGGIVELYGPRSSGKTTVALHAMADAQAAGGHAAFITAGHALDPGYAEALGVDVDNLLVCQPGTGEQALEIAHMLVRSGALDIIVVDPVAALVPHAEIVSVGETGEGHMGLRARLISHAVRKLAGAVGTSKTTLVFINQVSEEAGARRDVLETAGGRALEVYASVRIDLRSIGTFEDGSGTVGNRIRGTVVKNTVAPPFGQAEFDILHGAGISREGALIDVGVEQGSIRRSGAWYTYEGNRLGQGRENTRKFLGHNPEVAAEIEKNVKEKLGSGRAGPVARPRAKP